MKKRNPKIKKSAERTPRNNSPGEGKREGTARLVTLAAAFGLVLAVFSGRLVQMQLFNADAYRQEADLQSARTVSIKAPRGEIYDRYGRPLAVNRDGYAVVLDAAYLQASQTNETILRLCGLLKEKKEEWRDDLPISEAAPYTYMPDAEENTLSALQRVLGLNHYATAQNCVDEMIRRYKLEGYSAADQRTLMGVRYTMEALDYSVSLPYTFAEDISVETRAKIMEASFDFTGVNIEIQSVREYVATDIAPHIIGTIGPIYAEDWEELKKKGYSYNDMVGKSGAESAFEDLLRGTDGEKKIIQDQSGKVIQDVVVKEPVPGSSIMLTLDSSLQGVAQASLEEIIQSLRARENAVPATGGAVVVEKVNTGEILAAANYPTFDMKDYQTNYEQLAKDPGNPLFDRAFQGTYPPGSTFKPAIACIGLQTGVIDANSTVYCRQRYPYYDQVFTCLGYHGSENVITALAQSCNIFFYDVGRRCGIDVMNNYCRLFGFGEKTGVEVGESRGTMASPAQTKAAGGTWTAGKVLQFAIGQSDNAFTPLQLCNYTAVIANGGTRYETHLLYKVMDYSMGQVIQEQSVKAAAETGISESVFDTVKQGMKSVTSEGTAQATFRNYEIQVGGKTGTAEVPGKEDNGVFVAFAPFDNPEISISVVIEQGGHGSSVAPLARDIFDAYFFYEGDAYAYPAAGALLP